MVHAESGSPRSGVHSRRPRIAPPGPRIAPPGPGIGQERSSVHRLHFSLGAKYRSVPLTPPFAGLDFLVGTNGGDENQGGCRCAHVLIKLPVYTPLFSSKTRKTQRVLSNGFCEKR